MDSIPFGRTRIALAGLVTKPETEASQPHNDLTAWLSPAVPAGLEQRGHLERQAEQLFEELGLQPALDYQFHRYVPARVEKIRLQVRALARTHGVAKQQVGLAGLSMQCQWLAGYARMAGFQAVAQVAAALELLLKEMYAQPHLLTELTLRTLGQAIELLGSLSSETPDKAGRAEGARVLVVDDNAGSRINILCGLERFGITGLGIIAPDTALGLLAENSVDVILIRASSATSFTPQFCQAIRRLTRQVCTPIIVVSPPEQWDSRAVLAMSGASDVVPATMPIEELSLKVLGHYFRGRLGGVNA